MLGERGRKGKGGEKGDKWEWESGDVGGRTFHSHIIHTSFTHHLHIIYTSFTHHSPTSCTHHVHIIHPHHSHIIPHIILVVLLCGDGRGKRGKGRRGQWKGMKGNLHTRDFSHSFLTTFSQQTQLSHNFITTLSPPPPKCELQALRSWHIQILCSGAMCRDRYVCNLFSVTNRLSLHSSPRQQSLHKHWRTIAIIVIK